MPPLDPALARQPDLVEPVAGELVEPRGGQHREHAGAGRGIDDAAAGHGLTPPSASVAPITARSSAVTAASTAWCRRRWRPRGRSRRSRSCPCRSRDALVAQVGRGLRVVRPPGPAPAPRPGEARSPSSTNCQRSSAGRARHQAGGARSPPALTIGLSVRSSLQLDGHAALNGRPVLFTPSFSLGHVVADRRRTPGRRRRAWRRSGSRTRPGRRRPRASGRPPGLYRAEALGRGLGERRDVVRHRAVVDGARYRRGPRRADVSMSHRVRQRPGEKRVGSLRDLRRRKMRRVQPWVEMPPSTGMTAPVR